MLLLNEFKRKQCSKKYKILNYFFEWFKEGPIKVRDGYTNCYTITKNPPHAFIALSGLFK